MAKVHHLLHRYLGRGESLSRVEDEGHISVGALFHFRVVGRLGRWEAFQGRAELRLSHGVSFGALQGGLAHGCASRDGCLQGGGRRALQPAVRAGGGERRVDFRH